MTINSSSIPIKEGWSYWSFPTPSFSQFLSMASLFNWRSGRDLTSKSVSLSLSEDRTKVECRATDFDTYLLFSIPVESANPINKPIVFTTSTLIKLVKLCSEQVVIAQSNDEERPKFLIMGQWVDVEPVVLDHHIYINSDPVEKKGDVIIPTLLSSIIPIASSSTVPKDRSVNFYPNSIQSTCLWSSVHVDFETPIPFTLTSRECILLKSLVDETALEVGVTQSDLIRLVIKSGNSTVWFIYRDPEKSQQGIPESKFKVVVDLDSLLKLAKLSETLPSSTGILKLSWNNDNGLVFTYCNKLKDTNFPFKSIVEGNPSVLEASSLQTKILKQLLKPISESKVDLYWDNSTLYLSAGKVQVSIPFER